MKKTFVWVIAVLLTASSVMAQSNESHNFEVARNLEIFNDIYKKLEMFYVDTLSADTVMRAAIDAMLGEIDPFTEYYPADDNEEIREMTTGTYAGIGAVIRYLEKERRVAIIEPLEGSPATDVGLMAGDVILFIDSTDVEGKSSAEVSKMLRGEAGTTFSLTVRRYGITDSLTFHITRRNIATPTVPYYGMVTDSVGYVLFDRFVEDSWKELRNAVTDLKAKGAQALVLDLRGNPGGALSEAVEVTNLFVPKRQKVVYTRGKLKSVNTEHFTRQEPLDATIPLAVLVDGATASAAEIVAGALQDMDRAVIVGQRTYGKGLVQMVRSVPYDGTLKITTSRYYIPSGRCIQAYDYRHLNADGSARTLPDSLTHAFLTAGGREVRDGGGIKPDVEIMPDSLPSVVYDLATSDIVLEYESKYQFEHDSIAPAGEFALTDNDYNEFVEMVATSDFTYMRRTENTFNLLKLAAQIEGCYDDAKNEFDALEAKLDADIRADLMRPKNKQNIIEFLEYDIVGRYYFQQGSLKQQLKTDKELHAALDVLSDKQRYKQILHPEE